MIWKSKRSPDSYPASKWSIPTFGASKVLAVPPLLHSLLATAHASPREAQATAPDQSILLWIGLAIVAGVAISAAILQRRDKLIVFRDYTDATITVLSFLVPLAAFWVLKSNESDRTLLWLVSGGLLAVAVSLMLINTADANGGLGNPYFYLALAAKLIFMVVFLLLVALIVASMFRGSMARKSDETQWEYEQRKEREAREAAAAGAALAGLIAGGFLIFCKESGFGSPAPIFASVKRIFAGDLQAGSSQNALGLEIPLVPPRPISGAVCLVAGLAVALGWWSFSTQQIGGGGAVARTEKSAVTQAAYRKTEDEGTTRSLPEVDRLHDCQTQERGFV